MPDESIFEEPSSEEPKPEEVTPESRDAHLEGKVEPIGPKRRPGPNDDETEQSIASLKQFLPSDPNTGEFQTPQSLPVSTVEEDPSEPDFILVRDAFGKGMHSIRLVDGTPVGNWLKEQHPDLTGPEVEDLLARMGLEEVWPGRSEWFGKHRANAIAARGELESMPAVAEFAKAERLHEEQTAAMRAAFIDARKKDKK